MTITTEQGKPNTTVILPDGETHVAKPSHSIRDILVKL